VADEAIFELAQARTEAHEELDTRLLSAERSETVQNAMIKLPPHCQQILRLLMLDPPPSYEEIAAAIGRPIGSLGPSRGRCLEKLRVLLSDIDEAAIV
jgi:DNA-directed RNA polymerase specialized sigma24 family protein